MKTIVITGIDGSGKSTQARLLEHQIPGARIMSIWDLINNPLYRDWSVYKFPPPVQKYIVNLNPTARTLFIFHAFDFAYQEAKKSNASILIFDGFWYKYLAVELAMGTDPNIVDFIKNRYEEPDICFYLELPPDELLKRRRQISLYDGGNPDFFDYDNFIKIQKKAKKYIENFLPKKTIWLDSGKQSIQNINLEILNKIKKQLI